MGRPGLWENAYGRSSAVGSWHPGTAGKSTSSPLAKEASSIISLRLLMTNAHSRINITSFGFLALEDKVVGLV